MPDEVDGASINGAVADEVKGIVMTSSLGLEQASPELSPSLAKLSLTTSLSSVSRLSPTEGGSEQLATPTEGTLELALGLHVVTWTPPAAEDVVDVEVKAEHRCNPSTDVGTVAGATVGGLMLMLVLLLSLLLLSSMHSSTVILLLPSLSSNAEGIIGDVGADVGSIEGNVEGGSSGPSKSARPLREEMGYSHLLGRRCNYC